ncbi:unannotated protein [freshwater metagenome]|uniref:Unannotated protein n=1 Tax=freshwater metagenome TaxID=449393 RepID=A0A6J7L228_9ZZZZ
MRWKVYDRNALNQSEVFQIIRNGIKRNLRQRLAKLIGQRVREELGGDPVVADDLNLFYSEQRGEGGDQNQDHKKCNGRNGRGNDDATQVVPWTQN